MTLTWYIATLLADCVYETEEYISLTEPSRLSEKVFDPVLVSISPLLLTVFSLEEWGMIRLQRLLPLTITFMTRTETA
jgi:hypothetical protein